MVFVITDLRVKEEGLKENKGQVITYSLDAEKELPGKEFKELIKNRNKGHFLDVIEAFKNGDEALVAKEKDSSTWLRMGAGCLHLLELQGRQYIAVPRYNNHPTNGNKLSLCSGVIEDFDEMKLPIIRASIEGYEELLFVAEKEGKKHLLVPASDPLGREAALHAAEKIGLEAKPLQVQALFDRRQKDRLWVDYRGRKRFFSEFLMNWNFTNNSCNFIQVKRYTDEDIASRIGEVTPEMLTLYTFEEDQEGKRIPRTAHLLELEEALKHPEYPISSVNYDGNGSWSAGSTYYNPTLSLRTTIAKLTRSENWTDLLKVE